jgi:hypothetical protein
VNLRDPYAIDTRRSTTSSGCRRSDSHTRFAASISFESSAAE